MLALRAASGARNTVLGLDVVAFSALRLVVVDLAVIVALGVPSSYFGHD
jgi:hypothetical protein